MFQNEKCFKMSSVMKKRAFCPEEDDLNRLEDWAEWVWKRSRLLRNCAVYTNSDRHPSPWRIVRAGYRPNSQTSDEAITPIF